MKLTEATRRKFIKSFAIGTVGAATSGSVVSVAAASGTVESSPTVPDQISRIQLSDRALEAAMFRRSFGDLWSRIAVYTTDVAKAMPDEHYDFKPFPEARSFKEEMLHISDSDFWINSYFGSGKSTGDDYDAAGKSKAECVELMEASFANMSTMIEGLSDDELHTVVDTFAGKLNRMNVLWFMRDHITHHRAKSVVSLRLKGAEPPSYIGS
jgi:uncharacterized damage-inducible protein DinB